MVNDVPLFALCWEASSKDSMVKVLKDGVMGLKINKTAILGGVSGIAKGLLTLDNLMQVKQTFDDGTGLFKKARENAKSSGKILGHFIGRNFHFDSYSISLIGFSLGS